MEKREIRELLMSLEKARRNFLTPKLLEIGLTLGQGQPRILKNLLEQGTMTQRELANLCDVDVTTMSRTLDRMEESGLLLRQKNPDCRRSFLIQLTEDGREKAQKVIQAFEETDRIIWKGFGKNEMKELSEGLIKIRNNLSEEEIN